MLMSHSFRVVEMVARQFYPAGMTLPYFRPSLGNRAVLGALDRLTRLLPGGAVFFGGVSACVFHGFNSIFFPLFPLSAGVRDSRIAA